MRGKDKLALIVLFSLIMLLSSFTREGIVVYSKYDEFSSENYIYDQLQPDQLNNTVVNPTSISDEDYRNAEITISIGYNLTTNIEVTVGVEKQITRDTNKTSIISDVTKSSSISS